MLQISDLIPQFTSPEELALYLRIEGCRRCDLGYQPGLNGCCVARGITKNKLIILAEAPGRDENISGQPFTGPAGKKLDEIWHSVGMNTNNWYLTNCLLCRPIAPQGSGRENLTPKTEQLNRCRPFLTQQINLIEPKLIVALGAVATQTLCDKQGSMGELRGRILEGKIENRYYPVFVMWHPAYLLHLRGDQDKYNQIRSDLWIDIQQLKSLVNGIDSMK